MTFPKGPAWAVGAARLLPACVLASTAGVSMWLRGCGTANKNGAGGCKTVPASGMVASNLDYGSGPWTLTMSQTSEIDCFWDSADPKATPVTGTIALRGVIADSLTRPVGGLSVGTLFAGQQAGISVDAKNTQTVTDSCGGVNVFLNWVCPATGQTIGGTLSLYSGPLTSAGTNLVIKNVTVTPTPTPTIIVVPGTSSSSKTTP